MPFIHYLFVGDFDRDEHGVRFSRSSAEEPYRPVVLHPLTADIIAPIVHEVTGGVADAIPDDWSVWLDAEHGYLGCDLYTRNASEIELVTRLAERPGCVLYDAAGHAEISLPEWIERTNVFAAGQRV